MINRSFTRTILNGTETTFQTKTIASDSLAFELTTSDYFYLGFKSPFTTRYFHFSELNVNTSTLTVEYWNGTVWKSVEDLVDQTDGFTKNGFLSWINPGDWFRHEQAPVIAVNTFSQKLYHYWIRISVSDDLSVDTALQSVLNLFCDMDYFTAFYPEIANDTRYLPSGRTDFLEQLNSAKDLIVLRMKQKGEIKDEADILDINEVAVATAHATAYIILHPIAGDESTAKRRDDALKAMNAEIASGVKVVDQDRSGDIEEIETDVQPTHWGTR
jgi:hypothetical protein